GVPLAVEIRRLELAHQQLDSRGRPVDARRDHGDARARLHQRGNLCKRNLPPSDDEDGTRSQIEEDRVVHEKLLGKRTPDDANGAGAARSGGGPGSRSDAPARPAGTRQACAPSSGLSGITLSSSTTALRRINASAISGGSEWRSATAATSSASCASTPAAAMAERRAGETSPSPINSPPSPW